MPHNLLGDSVVSVFAAVVAPGLPVLQRFAPYYGLVLGACVVVGLIALWDFFTDGVPGGGESSPGRSSRGEAVRADRPRSGRRLGLASMNRGAGGTERQGAGKVYRERDSLAPIPRAGAFGEWVEREGGDSS